jgi:integrase
MVNTSIRISTIQRRFAPTVFTIVGIGVHDHRNAHQDLSIIKRAYNLEAESDRPRINHRIAIRNLDVSGNERTGFFEPEELAAILKHLPEDYGALARFANITGWRKRSLLSLRWAQVDFEHGFVRLDSTQTKNKRPCMWPITSELRAILEEQKAKADALKRQGKIVPWVFFHYRTRTTGKPYKRNGRPIVDFKKAWEKARTAAGLPHRIFHDLRRTSVRALNRAGVNEKVAMQMTGHKTRAVYDRYNITNEEDLQNAGQKVDEYSKTAFKDRVFGNARKL